jgi:xanthine dehydrogenase accessory factor
MGDVFVMRRALEEIQNGKELAIATITKSQGSAPRGKGAVMAVVEDRSIIGTIGGGAFENKVIELSLKAINNGESISLNLPLNSEGIEMTCGGEVDVFIDVYKKNPTLVIVGGGHVSYAVYKMASLLDFDIVIFEDRKEFLNEERFPLATKLVLGPIMENLKEYNIDENTYIVIASRGHKYDQDSLEVVAGSQAKYIGAMGSKKKVITMMENLKEKGISEEVLNKIYSPIGLKLSSGTPEEIAVSIIAEILMIKNEGTGKHMKLA